MPGEFARGELYGRLSEKQHKFASTLPRRELLRCMFVSIQRIWTRKGNQRGLGKVRNSKMKCRLLGEAPIGKCAFSLDSIHDFTPSPQCVADRTGR